MSNFREPQILIAEDENDWCERIALPLESEGYHIHIVSNHNEALNMLKGDSFFDLVCMNIVLRGEIQDGWKLDWTNLLGEAEKRRLNVIVITSMNKLIDEKKLRAEATEYGVKAIFFKNEISRKEFLKEVQKLVPIRQDGRNGSDSLNDQEKSEIRQLVKADDIEQALEKLENKKMLQMRAILLSGRLNRVRSELSQGTISQNDEEIERTRIARSLLELIAK